MCSGPGARGGGVGITPLYGLSEVWAAPKGIVFGLFMCGKGVNFILIGLIKCVFFTLAWHWVLNSHINSIYVYMSICLFITIYTTKYLSYDNRKSIVQAIIMSRLDYYMVHPLFILSLVSCNACRTRQLGWYVLYPGMIISHHP